MVETVEINLCRICLENGATIPLFENCENENCDLQTKLVLCLKEKIEDVEGYPRCICQRCSNIIDETYNLIKKYEDTCRILENGLDIVKKENEDFRCNEEAENEVDNIKYEYISNDDESRDDVDDDFQTKDNINTNKNVSEPFKTSIKLKTQVSKKSNYNKKVKQKLITSKIASSILEGEFSWSGEKWCLNTSPTNQTIKELPKLQRIKTEKKRYRIKIPKTKHPNPPKLCDLCGKVFNNQDKLNGHKRRIHFKQPVKCTMCSKILGSNYYLERHMKRAHSGERNFVCELCDRRFAFKGELTTHNRNVHNKHLRPHKQFKCKYCNKIYKCSKSVTIHERSTHTGQRPAVCTVCDSSFYHEDYLKEHMRLHTGETPFKCPICGRGYAQRGNMKSHLRIHRRSELDAATLNKIRPNYLKLLKA